MKKLLIFLFFSGYLCAQTTTPNLGMTKPAHNALNWDTQINANLDILDAKLACFGTGTVSGTIVYYNGSTWVCLPGNTSGTKVLQETSVGVPSWATVAGTGTVTSVLGTANQITSDGSTSTPTLSIASTFTFPGTVTNNLSIFGSTTSAQLATLISNETGSGLLVFGTSPTIITPTIASFLNAAHDHSNAAGGGQISLATCCTGVLAVANGGSGTATPSLVAGTNISITGTWPDQVINSTGGSGGGTWGSITGTLSSQTDLQTTLNLKANLASPTFTGTVVLPNSQILTTPTIANFTNATHAHNNAAGGGTLDAAVIATGLLSVARGGTATATPSIVAGTNISVAGTWPNQTITATGITDPNAIPLSQKGAASGVASLDSATKVVEPAKTLVGDPAETDPGMDFFPSTDKSVSAAGHVHLYSDGGVLTASQDAQPGLEIETFSLPLSITGATYTLLPTDKNRFMPFVTNSAVITLPCGNTTTFKPGFKATLKNDTFTTQTIAATSGCTIDSTASITFVNFQVLTVIVDPNLNWRVEHFSPGRAFGAYEVFGNMTGSTAPPTRGVLVAAAIPSLDTAKVTTGTWAAARMPALTGAVVTSSGAVATTPGKIDVLNASQFCSDAGSTDTYACSLSPAVTAYVTGTHYRFKANTANTGAATVNLNAVGPITIKKAAGGITTDLADNDIRAGQWVDTVYDGTNMEMQSTLGNAVSGGDASTNTSSSVDSEGVLFSGTGGKTLKRSTLTGIVRGASGVNTATELSGDATTSGSNAVTVVKVNGIAVSGTPAVGDVPMATSSSAATWQTPAVGGGVGAFINAYCNGVVGTGNGTAYYLVPFQNSTSVPTCAITGSGALPIPAACTLRKLYVRATTAGAQAGSGVITVNLNGSTSGITCTLGTGTSCNDTTHTAAAVAGDFYNISVTTGQASDTTATLRVALQCN